MKDLLDGGCLKVLLVECWSAPGLRHRGDQQSVVLHLSSRIGDGGVENGPSNMRLPVDSQSVPWEFDLALL